MMTRESANNHIRIVSLITLITGILALIPAVLLLFVALGLAGGGMLTNTPLEMFTAGGVVGFIAIVIAVLALPAVIAGFGLLARKSWARPLTLVLAVLNLFAFPIGTLIAAYQLWVLAINDETVAAYKEAHVDAGVRNYA